MENKQLCLWLTVGVMLVVTFDCGECNIQEKIGKVVPFSSATRLEDSESVLHRESRSVRRNRRSVLDSTEQPEALGAHNRLRRLEEASNMELMIWDNDLASEAENSANKCIWNHSNDGQNLYSTDDPKPINLTAAIEAWYAEKPNYSTFLSTGKCNPPDRPCLHYSQVVWAASRKLGCAYTRCAMLFGVNEPNALLLVCNYDPPGNIVGVAPFTMGSACSQCASGSWWCNNGLCDQSCTDTGYTCACNPVCQNSASVNRASCSCSCVPGWSGPNCREICKNNDPLCDPKPGQYGYPPSFCTRDDYGSRVRVLCPKMCGVCTVGCENKDPLCDPQPGQSGYPPSYCTHSDYGPAVRALCPAMCDQCTACALVCYNSGTLNSENCSCSCAPGWYGSDCSSACDALVCHNSGTLNSANCSCSCVPGWYGSDCSVVCENKDPLCDRPPGQRVYPPSYCTRSDYGPTVRVLCQAMCGQCTACALVCHNSGTLNSANCSCSCAPGWYGSNCSACALVCQNSGTVNSANCSCSCTSGWQGSDCSIKCKDFDLRCNPKAGENGWPPSYCSHGEYGATIRGKCPAMCNQCQAVCVDYDSRCDPQPGEYGWPSSYCTHSEYGNATRRFCPAMCKVCQAGVKSNYDVSTSTKVLLLSMLTVLMFRSTC